MVTQEQKSIIESKDQHIVVVANAGTGKTFTMIEKVYHLIKVEKVAPENILLTSFSRVASNELYEKAVKKIGKESADRITIGTIHSLCYKIVNENLEKLDYKTLTIVPEGYLVSIVFNNNSDLFEDRKEAVRHVSEYRKNLLMGIKSGFNSDIIEAIEQGQQILKSESKLLFDDLMLNTLKLFKKYPEVFERWNNMFKVIITDEAQDTNLIQWNIIRSLLNDKTKSIVVGDVKQNIYAFRGCSHTFMNDFRIEKNSTVYTLSETFRFGQPFADISNRVIEELNIEDIYKKPTLTNVKCNNKPNFRFMDYDDQLAYILEDINQKISEGFSYKDLNIIYRYNKEAIPFIKELLSKSIPFETKSGDVFDRLELRFVLKCYSAIKNFNLSDLIELLEMYPNFIGGKTLTNIYNSCDTSIQKDVVAVLNSAIEGKIEGVGFKKKESLKQVREMLQELFNYISGIDKESIIDLSNIANIMQMHTTKFMLKELENDEKPSEDRFEFLQFFQETFENSGFKNPLEWFADVQMNGSKIKDKEKNAVQLKTIHGCKGQSLPVVYFLANRICDKRFIKEPEEVENERYVFYVGLTRAEKYMEIFINDPQGFPFNFIFPKDLNIEYQESTIDNQSTSVGFQLPRNIKNMMISNFQRNARKYKNVLSEKCSIVGNTEKAIKVSVGTNSSWIPVSALGYKDNRFFIDEWVISKNNLYSFIEKF